MKRLLLFTLVLLTFVVIGDEAPPAPKLTISGWDLWLNTLPTAQNDCGGGNLYFSTNGINGPWYNADSGFQTPGKDAPDGSILWVDTRRVFLMGKYLSAKIHGDEDHFVFGPSRRSNVIKYPRKETLVVSNLTARVYGRFTITNYPR